MLDSLGVPNLFTTRFISYDPETGTGQKGLRLAVMHDEDIAEASPVCRKNRDILAHQLGSSISMECITDQKHTNYVHVASREDLGIPTVGNFALHRHYVDGVVTDIPDVLLTAFGADITAEESTAKGRADLVLKMPGRIYVIELKYDDSADAALAQIRQRGYADKYRSDGRPVTKVGISFSSAERNITEWKSEE